MASKATPAPGQEKSGFLREGWKELGRKRERSRLRGQIRRSDQERNAALTHLGERAWQEKVDLSSVPELRDSLARLEARAGELSATAKKLEEEKAALAAQRQNEAATFDGRRRVAEDKKRPVDRRWRQQPAGSTSKAAPLRASRRARLPWPPNWRSWKRKALRRPQPRPQQALRRSLTGRPGASGCSRSSNKSWKNWARPVRRFPHGKRKSPGCRRKARVTPGKSTRSRPSATRCSHRSSPNSRRGARPAPPPRQSAPSPSNAEPRSRSSVSRSTSATAQNRRWRRPCRK